MHHSQQVSFSHSFTICAFLTLHIVIIHAVLDLITKPNTVYKFWRVSPLECIIYFIGVIITVFTNIENGIYVSVGLSGAMVLFRIAKAKGHFLGKVKVHSVIGDHLVTDDKSTPFNSTTEIPSPATSGSSSSLPRSYGAFSSTTALNVKPQGSRHVYLPLDHHDGSNPNVDVDTPYPGVFVYRFSEGFLYPNCAHYTEHMVDYIFKHTQPASTEQYATNGDRPWNDPGPRSTKAPEEVDNRPTLRAIVLDFSSVNNVDITSVQNLLDVHNQLDRYASPNVVEWHFASIRNRWTKRALSSAGFGLPKNQSTWKPVFSVAEINDEEVKSTGLDELEFEKARETDVEAARGLTDSLDVKRRKVVPVHSIGRPFFHVDLDDAVAAAVLNVQQSE